MATGQLSGKIAIITGGSRGIGRAMALGLAAAGSNALITAASNPAEIEVWPAMRKMRPQAQ